MLQIRERASPHGDAVVCRGWSGLEARRIFSDRATGTEARLAAAAALVAVPDRAALPALVRVLGDTGEETALRLAAVGALEALGDLAAVPALLAVLASDEGNKRLNEPVAWALPTFGPAALPPLLAALSLARGATNHAFFVLTALGVLGDTRAITPLRAFLADPARAADHAAALDALHALGAAPPDAALAALARDPARGTLLRESAIGALVYPCRPAAVAALLALLDDPDRDVARAAIVGLGRCGGARAVLPLLARLGDPEGSTRQTLVFALGRLGDPRALPALRAAADDPYALFGLTMREAAHRAIAMIEDASP